MLYISLGPVPRQAQGQYFNEAQKFKYWACWEQYVRRVDSENVMEQNLQTSSSKVLASLSRTNGSGKNKDHAVLRHMQADRGRCKVWHYFQPPIGLMKPADPISHRVGDPTYVSCSKMEVIVGRQPEQLSQTGHEKRIPLCTTVISCNCHSVIRLDVKWMVQSAQRQTARKTANTSFAFMCICLTSGQSMFQLT